MCKVTWISFCFYNNFIIYIKQALVSWNCEFLMTVHCADPFLVICRHVNTAHVKSRKDPRKSRKSRVTDFKNPYTKGKRIFYNKIVQYLRIYSCSSILKWRDITFLWKNVELNIYNFLRKVGIPTFVGKFTCLTLCSDFYLT